MNQLREGFRSVAIFTALLVIFIVALSAWRIHIFQDIDIRVDQAFFVQWVRHLLEADHFAPRPESGVGWGLALERDEGSFLHQFAKPLITANPTIFQTASITLHLMASAVIGTTVNAQAGLSIVFAGLVILAIGLFPLGHHRLVDGPDIRNAVRIGGTAACVAGLTSFLHVFSPLGVHNLGVLTMMVAALAVSRWNVGDGGPRQTVFVVTLCLLAAYSHYVNVFLVLPAAALSVLVARGMSWRMRIRSVSVYGIMTVLGLLPAIAMTLIAHAKGVELLIPEKFGSLGFAAFHDPAGYVAGLPQRVAVYFETLVNVFTLPGLGLGVIGLVRMARRYRITVPLIIVGLHVFWSIFMPLFAQYDRTAIYILPMLSLGLGVVIVELLDVAGRWRVHGQGEPFAAYLAAFTALAVATHLIIDLPRFVDPGKTPFWGRTIPHIGRQQAMVREIETRLGAGAVVVPTQTEIAHQLNSLRRAKPSYRVFKPLSHLAQRRAAGGLEAYLASRRLVIDRSAPVFILATAREDQRVVLDGVQNIICATVIRLCSGVELVAVKAWPRTWFTGHGRKLYKVVRP